jgi:hypothetical protein
MPFFSKRALSPRERFESELKEKQAARENLAERLNAAEAALGEKRDAAERLAIAGATDAQLDRAETQLRAAEDRAVTLRGHWGSSTSRSPPPNANWPTPRRSATAT